MSLSSKELIQCPCGEVFEAEVWNSINAVEDPELKDAMLNKEINIVSCPKCGQIFYAEHFLLYHDSENELLAFVYPASFAANAAHWQEKMETDFKKATTEIMPEGLITYKPILLFGLDALIDILKEEQELDDEASILKYFAETIGLSLLHIKPYYSRMEKIPRVLPLIKSKEADLRGQLIEGLKELLKHNRLLSHYEALLDVIQSDSTWTLDKEMLVKTEKKKEKNTLIN